MDPDERYVLFQSFADNLVFGDAMEFEEGHVSMSSPIGRALVGKGIGDLVILKLPTSVRRLKVVELKTIHQQ